MLQKGEIIENNDASHVIDKYHAMLSDRERKESVNVEKHTIQPYKIYGTRRAEILDVQFEIDNYKNDGNTIKILNFGDDTRIHLKIKFHEEAINPIAGYIIRDIEGKVIYNTNTLWNELVLGKFKKDDTICITFSQRIFLNNGTYFITVALAYPDALQFYDWHDNRIEFNVRNNKRSSGIVDLQSKIQINPI